MIRNIAVQQAAELLGKRPQFIRIGLQQNRLPIGVAIRGSGRWSYHISPWALATYMGISPKELEDMLDGQEA